MKETTVNLRQAKEKEEEEEESRDKISPLVAFP